MHDFSPVNFMIFTTTLIIILLNITCNIILLFLTNAFLQRNDPFLKASLKYCFLDEQIQNVELPIDESLNVYVCGVDANLLPSVICQKSDESIEFKNLLKNMK